MLLPLFPLPVVLFPKSAVPLHIFEERYKILINRSISDRVEFGVNFVAGATVSAVGCSATVRDIAHKYHDGRMDIIVQGERRFKLQQLNPEMAPYPMGTVKFLDNPEELLDVELASDTIQLFNQLIEIVYKDGRHRVDADLPVREISFLLAQKVGMELPKRQRLLELDSENERLGVLRTYLLDVLPKVERVDEIERIIRGDGYL